MWICADMTPEDRFCPVFKKEFILTAPVKKAVCKVCGLGFFELRVNGLAPDDTYLNPALTQYSQTVKYREFDLTRLLRAGQNEITAELGHGFYNEHSGVWNWQIADWRDVPKLQLELTAEGEDGTVCRVESDESWLCTRQVSTVFNSLYAGETRDFREKAAVWEPVKPACAPAGKLVLQKEPFIRKTGEFSPVSIRKTGPSRLLIEAPETLTGWAAVRFSAPPAEGKEITLTYGEILDGDELVKCGKGFSSECSEWYAYVLQRDTVISGGKPFTFEPKFSYKGFRYIEIEGYDGPLACGDVTLWRVANDVNEAGHFSSSDGDLNVIHEMMVRTMVNNFQFRPTDTPIWEKNGWLGDANCALGCMMNDFDMTNYLRDFIDLMADCQKDLGLVPIMVPAARWGDDNTPVWNSVFVFGAEYLLTRCEQYDYVRALYPALVRYTETNLKDIADQGWAWSRPNLSDWVSPTGIESYKEAADSEGPGICATGFVYGALKAMIHIERMLGLTPDARWEEACRKIYDAFNARFWNEADRLYATGKFNPIGRRTAYRQTSQLVPLWFGLVPDDRIEALVQGIAEDVRKKGDHPDTGCIGTRMILPILTDHGYGDLAMRIIKNPTYPSWLYFARQGGDTMWEHWEPTTRSRDHYFLGTADEYLFTHLAGIRNISCPDGVCEIAPFLNCGPNHVSAAVPTAKGEVRVEWTRDGSDCTLRITVPRGLTASLSLPKEKQFLPFGTHTIRVKL